MKLFISYRFDPGARIQRFAGQLAYFLHKQPGFEPYLWAHDKRAENWERQITRAVAGCDGFVMLMGRDLGATQLEELELACRHMRPAERSGEGSGAPRMVLVSLPPHHDLRREDELPGLTPQQRDLLKSASQVRSHGFRPADALKCTAEVARAFDPMHCWVPPDGVPERYLYNYEKDIVEAYLQPRSAHHEAKWVESGLPARWPDIKRRAAKVENRIPLNEIGLNRWRDAGEILVDARLHHADGSGRAVSLSFREAGARSTIYHPRGRMLTAAVVVTGGIAPGINAVIAGIVNRHDKYAAANGFTSYVIGYPEGLKGMLETPKHAPVSLTARTVEGKENLGGSLLATTRTSALLAVDPCEHRDAIVSLLNKLVSDGVGILYVIGGDGGMKAAHALHSVASAERVAQDVTIVGIPKSIDNDILWVWQSLGLNSAVERATEVIHALHTEASSNPRVCVISLFGSDSGFVASHAALASGLCDAVLIPEASISLTGLADYVCESLGKQREAALHHGETAPHAIIAMAEAWLPSDVTRHVDSPTADLSSAEQAAIRRFVREDRRVRGSVTDTHRSAALKLVVNTLQARIQAMGDQGDDYWSTYRVFSNEPRHLIRAMAPSALDVIAGRRLGALAVDGAMAGYTDFMVSQWLTEYVMVPLELVVLGRKRIPTTGFFWRAIIDATRQPDPM